MKQTGGTKAVRSERKDRRGGEKRLDIWLAEFNKTLREGNNDKTEVAARESD